MVTQHQDSRSHWSAVYVVGLIAASVACAQCASAGAADAEQDAYGNSQAALEQVGAAGGAAPEAEPAADPAMAAAAPTMAAVPAATPDVSTPGAVSCGGVQCGAGEGCCTSPAAVCGTFDTCLAANDGNPMLASFEECDGPEDCEAGESCRQEKGGTMCAASGGHTIKCHTSSDCPDEAPICSDDHTCGPVSAG